MKRSPPLDSRGTTALKRAVASAGSQSALARAIGVRQSTISKWLSNNDLLPAKHVLKVEELTGISRHDLRHDLYPRDDIARAAPARLEGVRP